MVKPKLKIVDVRKDDDKEKLFDPQGRLDALASIAMMCINGYDEEHLSNDGRVVSLFKKNPSVAIRAILAIEKHQSNTETNFNINIVKDTA